MQPTMPITLCPEAQEGANARLAVVWVNFPGTSFAPNTLVLFTLVHLSINLCVSQCLSKAGNEFVQLSLREIPKF